MALAKTVKDFESNPKLGYAFFKERIIERDKMFIESKRVLIDIAKKYTDRLRSPSGKGSRISEVLKLDESNIVIVGVGKRDTDVGSTKNIAKGADLTNARRNGGKVMVKLKDSKGKTKTTSIEFRQYRAYDSFKFKLEYPYKKLLRSSIFYYSTHRRLRRYGTNDSKQKQQGWSGNKTMVYLPYIVNNTWKRHPQSFIRGRNKNNEKDKRRTYDRRTFIGKDELGRDRYGQVAYDHAVKTATSYPRIDKRYINFIVKDFNKWAKSSAIRKQCWNIEATYNKEYDK